MLVTMRDRGIALPAGAILISPWVDLTHSFPSVAADNPLGFIPQQGFHSRPSAAWPPPTEDDLLAIAEGAIRKLAHNQCNEADAIQGLHVVPVGEPANAGQSATATMATSRTSSGALCSTRAGASTGAQAVLGCGHELLI